MSKPKISSWLLPGNANTELGQVFDWHLLPAYHTFRSKQDPFANRPLLRILVPTAGIRLLANQSSKRQRFGVVLLNYHNNNDEI